MTEHDQDTILFYAFRYALGRTTYAASDMADMIIKYKDVLSENNKYLIKKEINRAIESLKGGMRCDAESWYKVLEVL